MYRQVLWLAAAAGLLLGGSAAFAQDADTVDGFHAYGTPHANALLALNGSARLPGSVIANNSIPGSRLVPGAVTAGRLGNNSVTTDKISDGQVMSADLAAGAVTRTKIANGAVTTTRIADQAVTGGKLAYGAVTAGRLADNSVSTSKIIDGAVRGEDVHIPLLVGGSRDGYLIGCFNGSSANSATGITGYSLATSGHTRGVVGACNSSAGSGVYGIAKSTEGFCSGVYGESEGYQGAGVRGYNSNMTGYTRGVYGEVESPNGSGVHGYAKGGGPGAGVRGESTGTYGVLAKATAEEGTNYGVYGRSESSAGYGVYGLANAGSGTNYGVYGATNSWDGYGVYSQGDCYVNGDQTVTGTKTGYVSDIVLNGGEEPLYPGDLVEIVWHAEPVVGRIPVAVVRKTSEASSKAVLGPLDSAVSVTDNEMRDEPAAPARSRALYHVKRADGAVLPGEYGRVVTLGLYETINVDASYGPIYPGDLLVSSPTPGYAMACEDPGVGTVVGKALGALEEGIGEIPVFVSSR